jgi:uncharacterized cupin superfamily protein
MEQKVRVKWENKVLAFCVVLLADFVGYKYFSVFFLQLKPGMKAF